MTYDIILYEIAQKSPIFKIQVHFWQHESKFAFLGQKSFFTCDIIRVTHLGELIGRMCLACMIRAQVIVVHCFYSFRSNDKFTNTFIAVKFVMLRLSPGDTIRLTELETSKLSRTRRTILLLDSNSTNLRALSNVDITGHGFYVEFQSALTTTGVAVDRGFLLTYEPTHREYYNLFKKVWKNDLVIKFHFKTMHGIHLCNIQMLI